MDLSRVKRAGDRAVLEQLIQMGDDLAEPRTVIVFFYTSDGVAGDAAVLARLGAELGREGWRTTVDEDSVIGESERNIDPDALNTLVDAMEGLAWAHGLEFDGWEGEARPRKNE